MKKQEVGRTEKRMKKQEKLLYGFGVAVQVNLNSRNPVLAVNLFRFVKNVGEIALYYYSF